jgi:hypothetical protein
MASSVQASLRMLDRYGHVRDSEVLGAVTENADKTFCILRDRWRRPQVREGMALGAAVR